MRLRSGGTKGETTLATGDPADASNDSPECFHSHRDRAREMSISLAQTEAALRIQRGWRRLPFVGRGSRPAATSIEKDWEGKRARRLGEIDSHIRYLQWLFRSLQTIAPGGWGKASLPRWAVPLTLWLRHRRETRCRMGTALASKNEFEAQRVISDAMLDWYSQFVTILRRLRSGVVPSCFDAFCGGGGWGEGIRRAGGSSEGMDLEEQPDYARRFGGHFTCGDCTSWSSVGSLRKHHRLDMATASPPCQFYSSACSHSRQPALIELTRDMLASQFKYWAMENVMGAKHAMGRDSVVLDGAYFRLRAFRSRLVETNFRLHIDTCVREPADRLRARCCLGARSKWRPFDEFGRPWTRPCCEGNVYAPLGKLPWKCTHTECAHAMGVDEGHMSYDRLAQAVPPAYAQLVYAQMCMRAAHQEYGCPVVTFDDLRARPIWARRTLAPWHRGAGDDAHDAGLALALRVPGPGEGLPPATGPRIGALAEGPREPRNARSRAEAVTRETEGIGEAAFRELYYAHHGGFDQQYVPQGEGAWLRTLQACGDLAEDRAPTDLELVRRNTYVEVGEGGLDAVLDAAVSAVALGGRGTRITVVAPVGCASALTDRGFELVDCSVTYGQEGYLRSVGRCAAWLGQRSGPVRRNTLIHDKMREHMDWRDRGGWQADPVAKGDLSWELLFHDASRWRGKGLPADVELMMTEGVRIEVDADTSAFETPQYPWPTGKAVIESALEAVADRALAVGHMEYVPDGWVERVLREHIVHPWLVVSQGEKWRLCQDYSGGTNNYARSAPFGLPTAWDVRGLVKNTSQFAKFDLRDGFWAVPIHPDSKCRLVIRHPITGRLMWCFFLPFGYLDSPRKFCRVTEAMADEMRRRAVGRGIYFWAYVDDFLIMGDDEELTREGMRILQDVMTEFGLTSAPHKERGPCRCIEFLGLLLCNAPDMQCIGLTEKRQESLRRRIDEWSARKPEMSGMLTVEPRELAVLLGHLVFASQVIPGGRTYMPGMLSAFAGLVVDWKRGVVRTKTSDWKLVEIRGEFWRDLEWWDDHLECCNCMPMSVPARAEACVTGTDASDWGAGSVAWLDGQREEARLEFGPAEKRRPINWRELLGILRIFEVHGPRLRGMVVLVETDNMAAKGAAEKRASTASCMQELLRRLLELAERHDTQIRLTHTPGEKLFRPDQTSRGDGIIEPRVRLVEREFAALESRFGPFSECVGAERRFASSSSVMPATQREGARLWLHPAHDTVGSALRLIGERMGEEANTGNGTRGDGGETGPPVQGVVLVPDDPSAQWWKLMKHFRVVGRLPVGGASHLEMAQLGNWKPVLARRSALILAFPRSIGAAISPIILREGMDGGGHVFAADAGEVKALPMPRGSVVYSPGVKGARGELFVVWRTFDPCAFGREVDEEGELRLSCAELLICPTQKGSGRAAADTYRLDRRGGSRGSFAPDGRETSWEVSAGLLWAVDCLVTVDSHMTERPRAVGSPAYSASREEARVFTFDWRRAEREVARACEAASVRLRDAVDEDPSTSMDVACEVMTRSSTEGGTSRLSKLYMVRDGGLRGLPSALACAAEVTAGKDTEARVSHARPHTGDAQREHATRVAHPCGDVSASCDTHPTEDRASTEARSYRELQRTCKREGLRASGSREELTRRLKGAGDWERQGDAAEAVSLLDESGGGEAAAEADLAAARTSALETVAIRTQPARPDRAPAERERPLVMVTPRLTICRCSGTRCEGCNGLFVYGEKVTQGVRALIHPRAECRAQAQGRFQAGLAVSRGRTQGKAGRTSGASTLAQARLAERTSHIRTTVASRCLEGGCAVAHEPKLLCLRGCGRGVHIVACLGESEHYRAAGRLICSMCRLTEMMGGADISDAPPALARMATISMCTELTTGAVSTAAGRNQFATLERRWMESVLVDVGDSPANVLLPRHSEESYIAFLWWLVMEADRSRSFATTTRAAGAVMAMQELTDWNKTARVKAIIKQIGTLCNVEAVPSTPVTRRMLGIMLDKTISDACAGSRDPSTVERLTTRTRALLGMELLGGMRVGEATSSGDMHGLAANDLCFSTPSPGSADDGLGETVEMAVKDSKTGPSRYIAFVATTHHSHLEGGRWMREWVRVSGLKMTTSYEGGLVVERPDYWVVRVSLAALDATGFAKLLRALDSTLCEAVAEQGKATRTYARRRKAAKNLKSDSRYVNVAGGERWGQEVASAWTWVVENDLSTHASIVPGPLMRATHGYSLSHMPLAVDSTYTHLSVAMKMAGDISAAMVEPDPELDLQGQESPIFTNHSLRRKSDGVARESMEATGATKQMIDSFYGWLLKEMQKDMQLHYAGLVRGGRRVVARVTMMM